MPKISLSAGGRDIEVEADDVDAADVADLALKLWRETAGDVPPAHVERGTTGGQTERAVGDELGYRMAPRRYDGNDRAPTGTDGPPRDR